MDHTESPLWYTAITDEIQLEFVGQNSPDKYLAISTEYLFYFLCVCGIGVCLYMYMRMHAHTHTWKPDEKHWLCTSIILLIF